MNSSLSISCDDCTARGTGACTDCVVTFICDRDPGDAVIIDAEEERAVRLLAQAGLIPLLRHRKGTVEASGSPAQHNTGGTFRTA